ncbi:hypothetical protein GCM10007036_13680 [Alsobacter metallidurans]|uniref:ParB/Sulfiredoxin domain-containing protein n=1 Tax=Alsobacter metallidurans TaxID=340221 RepID=A0A917MGE3_9HYPH|nr:hypothetical protein [Alsobacter metallidurans]GGH14385.1 hypothetical protein GCM10007036_13680 [Alsobacter metallidurans]
MMGRLELMRVQLYTSEIAGKARYLNFPAALFDCRAGVHGRPYTIDALQALKHNAKVEVEVERLDELRDGVARSEEAVMPQLCEPLPLFISEGEGWLLHGHHRLSVLVEHGCADVAARVAKYDRGLEFETGGTP